MPNNTDFVQCQVTTQRLNLFHIDQATNHAIEKNEIEKATITILTPAVVSSLPPYFSNIDNNEQARLWLKKMTTESSLLIIQNRSNRQIIGFVFLHLDKDSTVNLGYLLQESSWRQGFAKEFLSKFINWCNENTSISSLIAGVAPENHASKIILQKSGFVKNSKLSNDATDFYEYQFISD